MWNLKCTLVSTSGLLCHLFINIGSTVAALRNTLIFAHILLETIFFLNFSCDTCTINADTITRITRSAIGRLVHQQLTTPEYCGLCVCTKYKRPHESQVKFCYFIYLLSVLLYFFSGQHKEMVLLCTILNGQTLINLSVAFPPLKVNYRILGRQL